MRQRYREAPASVSEAWRDYFDAEAAGNGDAPKTAPAAEAVATLTPLRPAPAEARQVPASTAPVTPATAQLVAPAPSPDEDEQVLRGGARAIAERMEESIELPTATSVRTLPATLLEVNRRVINNQLGRRGLRSKVSFTHLIGWAVARALGDFPGMNAAYREVEGQPRRVQFRHVNLGLAMDLARRDGSRTLLVPNLKAVDEMDFEQYWDAYEETVRRVRAGEITPDDFAGTTATLTNPGTIGTVQSVPRLMPDQGVIIGVGRIGHPPEWEGADPKTLASSGIGRTLTMTSTYDHRIIQGAESGMFLKRIHDLLLGADGFYDEVFASLEVPYVPARWSVDSNPPPGSQEWAEKQARVFQLINMYRVRGHLMADLDPLRQNPPSTHTELDPLTYGLSLWDNDREFATGGLGGRTRMKLGDILAMLRDAYCRTSGIEYMHIQEPDQKLWIQQHAEVPTEPLPDEVRRRLLRKLIEAEDFEQFLHRKFLGAKRFSLEGSEVVIALLDGLLNTAADYGMEAVALGMSHRGRLNVLANVVHKGLTNIFREFTGGEETDESHFSGDVKYHLGARGTHTTPDGRTVTLELAANPSHLEAIDPVLEGITRARQDARGYGAEDLVLPVMLHGDAAFSGQGVVAETLNLSQLAGYHTGGTIHIVINNQVGFTTSARDARSSFYATDVAKAVQAPIFHVNGDDPEAVLRVTQMAFSFREAFHKDVVVDVVAYRRLGHNEGDEPSYTQPKMYRVIDRHPTLREQYAHRLVNGGLVTEEEVKAMGAEFRAQLDAAFDASRTPSPQPHSERGSSATLIPTRIDRELADGIEASLRTLPDGFTVHPKLAKLLADRDNLYRSGHVDWALAEALAFGSLSLGGTRIRLAGEDSQRGTFSHRHAVLVDYLEESEHTPLQHLHPDQAPLDIYDSLLSEFAALGFEYGYSVAAPDALVMWEAQFGDFVNGAQVVIDQFLSSGMDKWDQTSGVVLLLPHGYEGQGPEHSSARLERFLSAAAEDNMRIAVPSTPGQYFHLLRLQALHPEKRPLVVMTPKSLLRARESFTPIEELTDLGFQKVIPDKDVTAGVRRVVLCSGKVYYDLVAYRRAHEIDDVAVVRVEMLYPFPAEDINRALAPYGAVEVVWAQEEPANMGAWRFISRYLFVEGGRSSRGIYRHESASPATGNPKTHLREQREIVEKAFG